MGVVRYADFSLFLFSQAHMPKKKKNCLKSFHSIIDVVFVKLLVYKIYMGIEIIERG